MESLHAASREGGFEFFCEHVHLGVSGSGAGYGDRTRVRGLGSLCTTIVLSPRFELTLRIGDLENS